jgi:hypothetical protein
LEAQSGEYAEGHPHLELWIKVVDRFLDLEDADESLPMDSVNDQDLCAHLHRQGVYMVLAYHPKLPKIGRLSDWDMVPLVQNILTIPRENLAVLGDSVERLGTPFAAHSLDSNQRVWCDSLSN